MERSELTFLVSVRVPSSDEPRRRSETFASQRTLPSSMRAFETPSAFTRSRMART